MKDLERIVAEDKKQRYSFNMDKTLIRANQGHSNLVDVELEQVELSELFYHGTATKYEEAIDQEGLKPKVNFPSRGYHSIRKDFHRI